MKLQNFNVIVQISNVIFRTFAKKGEKAHTRSSKMFHSILLGDERDVRAIVEKDSIVRVRPVPFQEGDGIQSRPGLNITNPVAVKI